MEDKKLKKLVSIMERLRSPEGCPWDREQNFETLTPFIVEEAYEVVGAIESGDTESIKEELGDLLFQVVFVSQLAKEAGEFDINDVIESSVEKMTRRHPHVFGDTQADTSAEVLKNWAEIKKQEGKDKKGQLSGVTEAFPSLLRAHKLTEKAAKVGFDWKDRAHVLEKLSEELEEFQEAVLAEDTELTEEEMGDMLFTLVNVSRFVQINPEQALRKTIGKFINRFHHIEQTLEGKGQDLSSTSAEEMEELWKQAKRREKSK